MSIKTPSIETLALLDSANKIKINCVWQKGGIENYNNLISMMEILGYNGIKELRNISLLPLNEKSIEKYIDLTTIMKECEEFFNNGYLYDKHMCKCLEFVYLSKSGGIVKNIIRQTFDDNYDCVKQFVYDGQFLYDGFKKNNIEEVYVVNGEEKNNMVSVCYNLFYSLYQIEDDDEDVTNGTYCD